MTFNPFDSIVQIYSGKNAKGIGFVLENYLNDGFSYIITCNHVVYDSGENKSRENIKVDDIDILEENIVFGHTADKNSVDLAVIKINERVGKGSISIEEEITQNAQFTLVTYAKVGNDKISFDGNNIDLKLKEIDSSHRYNHKNSHAYEFKADEAIESGYSGSPIIDKKTQKVVAILNISKGVDKKIAKGLSVSNIKKVFPEFFKEIENRSIDKKSHKISVFFKASNENGKYDVIINNEPLNNIDIEANQKDITDKIIKYATTNEADTIELFVERELFTKDIHQWRVKAKQKLSQKYRVIFRSINLKELEIYREKWQKKWKKDLDKCCSEKFEASISKIIDDDCFDSSIISAVFCKNEIEADDFEALEDHCISISIWKNRYDEKLLEYKELLKELKKNDFEDVYIEFKEQAKSYPRDICLMWDDPTNLPKKDLKDG